MSSPWAGRLGRGRNRSLESNPEKPLKSRDWLKVQEKTEETPSEEEEETQNVVQRSREESWEGRRRRQKMVESRPTTHIAPQPWGSEPSCFAVWCDGERTEHQMNSAKWGKEYILEWQAESTLIRSTVIIITLLITTTFWELNVHQAWEKHFIYSIVRNPRINSETGVFIIPVLWVKMLGAVRKLQATLSPGVCMSLCSFLRWGLVSSENEEAGPRPGALLFYSAILLSGIPASLDQEEDHWRGIGSWNKKELRRSV